MQGLAAPFNIYKTIRCTFDDRSNIVCLSMALKEKYNLIFNSLKIIIKIIIKNLAVDNFSPIIHCINFSTIPLSLICKCNGSVSDDGLGLTALYWTLRRTIFLFTSGAYYSHKSLDSLRRRRMTRRVMAKILSDDRESATVVATMTPKKGTRSRSHTSLPLNDYRCSSKRLLYVVLAVVEKKRLR